MLHSHEQRYDQARAILDSMPDSDFDNIDNRPLQFLTPSVTAYAVADVGHIERARQLIPLLEPHRGRLVNFFLGMQYRHWVDHYLGRLRMVTGEHDVALADLGAARQRAVGLGATLLRRWSDLALVELATAIRRDGGTPTFAVPDVTELAEEARGAGHMALERRARALVDRSEG